MPKTESAIGGTSGLFTKDETPVPLTGVSVDAEVSSFCARVTVTQRYVNRESVPIEAVYVFPLDEGAAVCGFEAIIDGTLVVGEVKEREEAFRMYDEAMEEGHGAYLLDEERPDVFQASVGNLPPGKEALLKLTYVTELSVEGRGLRFAIPTTVSPRYAPAEDRVGVGRPDSEALNPPVAWHVPYGLSLSVKLAMAGSIGRIESPSHPVSVRVDGCQAEVTLSQRETSLDRDFVLAVEAAGLDRPQAWVERDDNGDATVAIAFVPKLTHEPAPNEVIFLVDRSGSMGGSSMEEVRNALQLCLRSMIAGCRFNIVGFGSTFKPLFAESRAYDEGSLRDASDHVASLQADLGGTEILPALKFVLEQPLHAALARQVVVLTDGEVTNTDAVLALARQHAAARVFTFGIGAGASHHLVRGLARAGRGAAELIYPGERIEPKVVRQFGRLLSQSLADVRMDWSTLGVTQVPSLVPPVFADGRLLIYGFVKSRPEKAGIMPESATVNLMAMEPAGSVTFAVPIDFAKAVEGCTVGTLAARARIRELEESSEWTTARGSRQHGRKKSGVQNEILALSLRYGLASREASFVAIERRETPVAGDIQLRRVPIALTSGWGGLGDAASPHVVRVGHVTGAMLGWESAPSDAKAFAAYSRLSAARAEASFSPLQTPRVLAPSRVRSAPPVMRALIALQRADGSWDLSRDLADAMGLDLSLLEAAVARASADLAEARRAWGTALALAWLRANARDVEDEWRLLAAKARLWLDRAAVAPPDRGTWLDAARRFLECH